MFTGAMTPEDVLKSIDQRRADMAKHGQGPGLGRSNDRVSDVLPAIATRFRALAWIQLERVAGVRFDSGARGHGEKHMQKPSLSLLFRQRRADSLPALLCAPQPDGHSTTPLPTGTATRPRSILSGWRTFALIFSSGSSQNYLHFIRNTVIFTVATIVLKTVIALGLALLLTRGIKRTGLFPPRGHVPARRAAHARGQPRLQVDSQPGHRPAQHVACAAWVSVFWRRRWLVDVHWALPSVIAVDTWRGVGYIMVILIAGLQAIPQEYYEAAAIDGASGWACFLAHHDCRC